MTARARSSDTVRAAGMGLAAVIDSVLALLFTVIVARILGPEGYGSLAALVSAFLILSVAGTGLLATVAREIGWRRAAGTPVPAATLARPRAIALAFAALIAVSVALRETCAAVIGVEEEWAAAVTLPMAALWLYISAQRGILLGVGAYRIAGFSVVAEPAGWLVFGVAAALLGLGVTGAFLGIAIAEVALVLFLHLALLRLRTAAADAPPERLELERLLGRAAVPMAALALFAALQNLDVIAVQHLATEARASAYAAASVAAKVVVWLAIGLGLYLLPEAARRAGEGVEGRTVLLRTLAVLVAAAVPMIAVYAVAGSSLLELVFGADLAAAGDALPVLGAAMTLLAIAYLAVQYQLAVGRRAFLLLLGAAAAIEPLALSVAGDGFTDLAVALVVVQLAAASGLLALALAVRSAPNRAASDHPTALASAEPADRGR